jgi:hypothetical protein
MFKPQVVVENLRALGVEAGLDEGLLAIIPPNYRLYGESL